MVAIISLVLLAAPNDSEARFFLAEQLWSAHRVAEAALEFRHVALDPKCRFARDAAYNYVLARRELVTPSPQPRFDGKPWPLTVEKQALVDAIDFFVALLPDDRDAEDFAYQAARLYFEADDFVQAEHRLMWMVFHGHANEAVLDLFRLIEEQRKRPVDGVGEGQAIGAPQTIGEPQDLGGDSWESTDSYDEEVGEDFEEYVVP